MLGNSLFTSEPSCQSGCPERVEKRSKHQMVLFTRGVLNCPLRPYFYRAEPCLLGGWSICLERAFISTVIASQGSSGTNSTLKFYSSWKIFLFSHARIGTIFEW